MIKKNSNSISELENKAQYFRRRIMEVGYQTKGGHLSSALSCIDILVALYYDGYLNINIGNYENDTRNRFVLSKGHACLAQFLILSDLGIIDANELKNYCRPKSMLGAHPDCLKVPGIDASTGALGHGLSIAIGMAIAQKYKKTDASVYVILGDGECQEGSVWEAAICASQHKLDNLTVIIDNNKIQGSDYVDNIASLEPFDEKWKSFGFESRRIDGNNMEQIIMSLDRKSNGHPKAIIADTIKGKGVPYIENDINWHGRKPNDSEWEIIKHQLEPDHG